MIWNHREEFKTCCIIHHYMYPIFIWHRAVLNEITSFYSFKFLWNKNHYVNMLTIPFHLKNFIIQSHNVYFPNWVPIISRFQTQPLVSLMHCIIIFFYFRSMHILLCGLKIYTSMLINTDIFIIYFILKIIYIAL